MEAYKTIEELFERTSGFIAGLFSNPLVFIMAMALTAFWFFVHDFKVMTQAEIIRDLILAITFLSFFIIQRSFSHFSQSLHLKLNELIAAQENARNGIIKAEVKTDQEIKELAKEHDRLIELEQDKKS